MCTEIPQSRVSLPMAAFALSSLDDAPAAGMLFQSYVPPNAGLHSV